MAGRPRSSLAFPGMPQAGGAKGRAEGNQMCSLADGPTLTKSGRLIHHPAGFGKPHPATYPSHAQISCKQWAAAATGANSATHPALCLPSLVGLFTQAASHGRPGAPQPHQPAHQPASPCHRFHAAHLCHTLPHTAADVPWPSAVLVLTAELLSSAALHPGRGSFQANGLWPCPIPHPGHHPILSHLIASHTPQTNCIQTETQAP